MSQTFHLNTKILIAEDTGSVRDSLKTQLRELGYRQIVEASDGRSAYQEVVTARASQDPFGLILSDLHMPHVSGIEFLKMVRAMRGCEQTPFIIITAETDRTKVMEALSAGVSNYIMKPLDDVMLRDKLSKTWQKTVVPPKK